MRRWLWSVVVLCVAIGLAKAQGFQNWPKEDQEVLLSAEEDFNFGDLEAAIAALEALARKHPEEPRVWRLLALAYTEIKAYSRAQKAYARWRSLVGAAANEDREAVLYEARALAGAGEYRLASARLKAWLGRHPEDAEAMLALLDIETRRKAWDEVARVAGNLTQHASPAVRAAGFYYLAVAEAQRGRLAAARKAAEETKRLDAGGSYGKAAEDLLKALRAQTGPYARVGVGVLHTSNVELLPDIVRPRGGKRADNYLMGELALGWRSERWEVGYLLSAQKYFRRTDFDFMMQMLRVPVRFGSWTLAPVAEHAMLGGAFLFMGGGADLHWRKGRWLGGYELRARRFSSNFGKDRVDLRRLGGLGHTLFFGVSSNGAWRAGARVSFHLEQTKGDAQHPKTDDYQEVAVSADLGHTVGAWQWQGSVLGRNRRYRKPDPLAGHLKRRDQWWMVQMEAGRALDTRGRHRVLLHLHWQQNRSNYRTPTVPAVLDKTFKEWAVGLMWRGQW